MTFRHLDKRCYPSLPFFFSNRDLLDLVVDHFVNICEFLGLSPQLCQKKGRSISLQENDPNFLQESVI